MTENNDNLGPKTIPFPKAERVFITPFVLHEESAGEKIGDRDVSIGILKAAIEYPPHTAGTVFSIQKTEIKKRADVWGGDGLEVTFSGGEAEKFAMTFSEEYKDAYFYLPNGRVIMAGKEIEPPEWAPPPPSGPGQDSLD